MSPLKSTSLTGRSPAVSSTVNDILKTESTSQSLMSQEIEEVTSSLFETTKISKDHSNFLFQTSHPAKILHNEQCYIEWVM